MMTVVYRGRRTRRLQHRIMAGLRLPMTWLSFRIEEHDRRTMGSGKPGRGGRRKRRRRASGSRAFIAYRETSSKAMLERSWHLLPACGLDPSDIGRRERRRRAKLRRRRARRRAGWTTITSPPGLWKALAVSHLFRQAQRRDMQRLLRM
jgi:hypothetical protein